MSADTQDELDGRDGTKCQVTHRMSWMEEMARNVR